MEISDTGIELIKSFEGFRATPYEDVAGKMTIGFGHLILPGEVFGALSSVEATALLIRDIAEKAEKWIDLYVKVNLTQNEYDALCSFVYNVGAGNFRSSTLLDKLNQFEKPSVPTEMLKWCKAGGATVKGLLQRRQKEADLFQGPSVSL